MPQQDLNLYFNRQLEHISQRARDVIYAELRAPKMIPVNSEAGPAAKKYTYRQYDMVGAAQFIANYGTDFKIVDISGKEFSANIEPIGDSYEYSFQDLRAAQMAGLNLEQRRANAATRAMLQKENAIAFFGAPEKDISGFFTNTNVPQAIVPNDGVGASTLFANKDSDQIIRDVSKLINDITVNTKEVERANTVLFPTSIWTFLKSTPRSSQSDTSIATWLMDNFRDQISTWATLVELETAGPGGTKMMVAYDKNPDKLDLQIPQPMEQLPVFTDGVIWKVRYHERIGGVVFYYPLSCNMAYGI